MMSTRRAPTARRTPISRVRSSTLASMMFMMPMPPTSSEIDAMATMTTWKIRRVRCCSASSSAGTSTLKSPAPRCAASSRPRTIAPAVVTSRSGRSAR